jgi:hypothetical protein
MRGMGLVRRRRRRGLECGVGAGHMMEMMKMSWDRTLNDVDAGC